MEGPDATPLDQAHAFVVGRKGAVVRRTHELESDVVGELPCGAAVEVTGRAAARGGANRCRIAYRGKLRSKRSMAGWCSARVLSAPGRAGGGGAAWYEVSGEVAWISKAPGTPWTAFHWRGARLEGWLAGETLTLADGRGVAAAAGLRRVTGPTAPRAAAETLVTTHKAELLAAVAPRECAPRAGAVDASPAGLARGMGEVDRSYTKCGLGDGLRARRPDPPPREVDAAALSPGAFAETYVASNEPCVLRGALGAWPPLRRWAPGDLKGRCGGRSVPVRRRPRSAYVYGSVDRVDLYETGVAPFRDVVDGAPVYAARVELGSRLPEMAADCGTAPPGGYEAAFGPPKEVNPVLYYGAGESATPLHFDPAENLLCVVAGEKRVSLFHPADTPYLYPCGDRNAASVYATVDAYAPDYETHPRFADAKPVTLVVRAGDALYLPCGWWHAVRGGESGRTVSVNYWFQVSNAKFEVDAAFRLLGRPQDPTSGHKCGHPT